MGGHLGHSKPFAITNNAVLNNLVRHFAHGGLYLQEKFLEVEFLGERIHIFVISKIIADCSS